MRIASDPRSDRGVRVAAYASLVLRGDVASVLAIESTTDLGNYLDGLGRLMVGLYIVGFMRRVRAGEVMESDREGKVDEMWRIMSKYMIPEISETGASEAALSPRSSGPPEILAL